MVFDGLLLVLIISTPKAARDVMPYTPLTPPYRLLSANIALLESHRAVTRVRTETTAEDAEMAVSALP